MTAPIVLLHGYTGTPAVWEPILPLLSGREVHVVGVPGHVGTTPLPDGVEPSVPALADALEPELREIGPAHLVGNSLGGWLALLMAARGHARSVVALCPAGLWTPGTADEQRVASIFRRSFRSSRAARPLLPLLLKPAPLRRKLLADLMVHGERLSPQKALQGVDDFLACPAYPGLLEHCLKTGTVIESMTDPGVPVLVAQGEEDRFFPHATYQPIARERLPFATLELLPGVGHVPMADDPQLIARTISDWVERAGIPAPVADRS